MAPVHLNRGPSPRRTRKLCTLGMGDGEDPGYLADTFVRPIMSQALTISFNSAIENGPTSFGLMLRGDLMRFAIFSGHHFRS